MTWTASEAFLGDRWYRLFEHPTKTVEASSEDMHSNFDIPGDQKTESYNAETNNVHTHLAEWEDNGSETDDATSKGVYTSLDTLEDKGGCSGQIIC